MLPNFLIVGSAKCGTTSLYAWLKTHPEVFLPEFKEPGFFVRDTGFDDWGKYQSLFAAGEGKKAVGEATTDYLFSPESPDWIRRVLGDDVRILILIRNPVERAFSLYKYMLMEGFENVVPFEKALALEERRFADEAFRALNREMFWAYMYVRTSFYCESIERYMSVFDRRMVKILVFDDIVTDPHSVFAEVCEFLEISGSFRPRFSWENKSATPRSVALQRFLRRNMYRGGALPPLGALWRASVARLMAANKSSRKEIRLQPATRQKLGGIFAGDVDRLGRLLDRDLSHWLRRERDDLSRKSSAAYRGRPSGGGPALERVPVSLETREGSGLK